MIINNPLISKLANVWLAAETGQKVIVDGNVVASVFPQAGALEHAADRVKLVLQGEVRWSEASPGDKAIWNGRLRETGKFNRWWRADERAKKNTTTAAEDDLLSLVGDAFLEGRRLEAAQILNELAQLKQLPTLGGHELDPMDPPPQNVAPSGLRRALRLHGYRESMWWNFYDTALISPDDGSRSDSRVASGPIGSRYRCVNGMRLFGNANVGDSSLTNIAVPGQLDNYDKTCVILGFYVASPSLDGLCWAADRVRVQLWIGDRPSTPEVFVRDLVMGVNLPRPLVCPVRQNFGATVFMSAQPPASLPEFDLTLHLDCLLTRDVA